MPVMHPWLDTPCTQDECRQAQEVWRDKPEPARKWGERACHERFAEGKASALVAEICPDCRGVVPGSAAGTSTLPTQRDERGRFVAGRRGWIECRCSNGRRVNFYGLAKLHDIDSVLARDAVSATGARQD